MRIAEGDREGAIRLLAQGVENGWRLLFASPGDPLLGTLEGDPRYDRIMTQVRGDLERQRARVRQAGW